MRIVFKITGDISNGFLRIGSIMILIIFINILLLPTFSNSDPIQQFDIDNSETIIESSEITTRSPIDDDTWQMFSHDLHHTGNTTGNAPGYDHVLWYNLTGSEGEIYASPIVYNGRVFVGTRSSYLYSFDEDTGKKLWEKSFSKVTWGMCGSATCLNSNLYIGSEDENIYCLNPVNGSVVWKYKTGGAVWSCPAVIGGKVYAGSVDKYVYCLDESNGKLDWKFKTKKSPYGYQDYGISSSPAVSNGRLFIGACDGDLYCLPLNDPNSDGEINESEKLWEFNTGCYIYASPSVYNGNVYIGTGSYSKMAGAPAVYNLYCLNISTGNLTWEFTAGSYILGTPSIAYGKIFIGSLDGYLYCLPVNDPDSSGIITASEVIWKFNAANEIWGSVAIAQERLYFGSGVPYWEDGSGNYKLFCIPINDPNNDGLISSSEIIWSYDLSGGVLTTPAIVNGKIFVSTYDGYVYCFSEDTVPPKIKSTVPAKDAINVPLDSDIHVEFNEAINPSTLTSSTFLVEDSDSKKVEGEISYNNIDNKGTFDPTFDLKEGVEYSVTLTSDILDLVGNGLDVDGDGVFEPDSAYFWSFTTVRYPPILDQIPTQHPIEGVDWHLNMSLYVTDANTPFNELTITENSAYAKVKDSFIVFNYPNGISTEDVNISVSDGISTVWQDVLVQVKQTNDPPVISKIPEIYVIEDVNKILDMSLYVADVDNELEQLHVSVNTTYAKVSGLLITFNYPNGMLIDYVNITVDDANKSAFQHVKVYIEPVNDAPVLSHIPDQEAIEDIDLVVNITEDIFDIDNSINELTVTTNSSYATVDVVGGGGASYYYIIFNYPDRVIYETVNITVSDLSDYSFRHINVTVTSVDDPPMISKIPEQQAIEDIDFIFDLSKFITDEDTLIEEMWISTDSKNMKDLDGFILTFNFPNGVTEELVNISLYEGSHVVFAEVKFIVTPINDQPELSNGQVTPASGNTKTEYKFAVIYRDIDGDSEPVVELVINNKQYKMSKRGSSGDSKIGITYIIKLKLGKGEHEYYFQCDDNSNDPNNTYETGSLTVKVKGEASEESNVVVLVAVIVIILIIVFVLIILLFWKKRHKVEESPKIEPQAKEKIEENKRFKA